jgi:hypothetical protein
MATKPKPVPKEGFLCIPKLPCCRCVDGTTTEINIDTGAASWRVTAPGGAYQQAAVPIPPHPAWATLLGPAAWIGAPGAPETEGDYEFELQFYVPDCVIPAEILVTGQAAADNRADIFLDSSSSSLATVPSYDNSGITSFVGSVSGAGIHRLRFVVTNDGGPTGLIVRAAIVVRCPRQLEHGPGGPATAPGGGPEKA